MCIFKNLEEILKSWKIFEKMSGNPVHIKMSKIQKHLTRSTPGSLIKLNVTLYCLKKTLLF